MCLPGSLLLSGAWRGRSFGALSDDVRFDVLQGSWRHDALSLDRYPNNPLAPQYTAVPAAIPALALGVLGFGPDTGFVWFAQDSMPSAQRLNEIAVGVDASDIKFWDGERDQLYRSAFALREALAGFVAQHFDLADSDSPFLITGEEDRFDAALDPYQANHLRLLNELEVTSLEGDDGTLAPWVILGWLLPFSLEPPDEDSDSDFSRVMKVMNSYAEKMDPALF